MLSEVELRERIRSGEDAHTQFWWERPAQKTLARLAVGFANQPGEGLIIFGVHKNGHEAQIDGVDDPVKLTRRMLRSCQLDCTPPIAAVLEQIEIDRKTVVLANLEGNSFQRPYQTRWGECFVRDQSGHRQKLPLEEARQQILRGYSILGRVGIERFRSLFQIDLELKPITLFIGPNASGKSNLLKALRFVRDAMVGDISQWESYQKSTRDLLWYGSNDASFRANTLQITLTTELADEPLNTVMNYELTLRDDQRGFAITRERLIRRIGIRDELIFNRENDNVRTPAFARFGGRVEQRFPSAYRLFFREYLDSTEIGTENFTRFVRGWRFLDIKVDQIRRGRAELNFPLQALDEDGANLAEILFAIQHRDRGRYDEIMEWLRRAIDIAKDIDLQLRPGFGEGNVQMTFREAAFPNQQIPTSNISDGTLRLLAILTAVMGDPEASLICIEEPDHGLHPHLMQVLADCIKTVVSEPHIDGLQSPPQVILTTHSTEFLDRFDVSAEKDYLLIYSALRDPVDGKTVFRSADRPDFAPWLKLYRAGDALRRGVFDR